MPDVIVTQHIFNVDADADPERRVTQVVLESDVEDADVERRVTQVVLESDVADSLVERRVTQVVLEVDTFPDPPGDPSDVEVTPDPTTGEIDVTWDPTEPYVDETEITQCVNGVCELIATLPGNPGIYTVTDPPTGTVCYYIVFINANGRSGSVGACVFLGAMTKGTDLGSLYITDGTTRVNLIGRGGFKVCKWAPASVPHEVRWEDSPLRDGRTPTAMRLLNAKDKMELVARHPNQNLLIHECMDADLLLTKAVQYWMQPDNRGPVWIVRRAPSEHLPTYAVIMDYSMPEVNNPYVEPFAQRFIHNGMRSLILEIEHGPWLSQPPGQTECLPVSGTGMGEGTGEGDYWPTIGAHDGYQDSIGGAEFSATMAIPMGMTVMGMATADVALLFPNVPIPAGMTILSAVLEVTAADDDASAVINQIITGELPASTAPNPQPLGTPGYPEIITRAHTVASVAWNAIPAWVNNVAYTTPDLSPIVQEIIDDATWTQGNNVVLLINDNSGGANVRRRFQAMEMGKNGTPATLTVTWTGARQVEKGYERDCLTGTRAPLVAAMNTFAQITHAFTYDASAAAFSANLIGTALPYTLFPNPAADGDMLYVGIPDTSTDYGPFASTVFDLDGTGLLAAPGTITAQYWSGAAWTDFPAWRVSETDDFQAEGIVGEYWDHVGWAPTVVNAINGYWVRWLFEANGGGTFAPPDQINRDPFAVIWGSVEVPAGHVAGTLHALTTLKIEHVSGPPARPDDWRRWTRLMIGLRGVGRGADFTAYLNATDTQQPANTSAVLGAPGTGTVAFIDDMRSPTGRALEWDDAALSVAWHSLLEWRFLPYMATQYMGRYRAFLRGSPNAAGVDKFSVRLQVRDGYDALYQESRPMLQQRSYFPTWKYAWTDLGILDLRMRDLAPTELRSELRLRLQGWHHEAAAAKMEVWDLFLLPIDEWSGDYWRVDTGRQGAVVYAGTLAAGTELVIDPNGVPRQPHRALAMSVASPEQLIAPFASAAVEPPFLHPGAAQRLWLLPMGLHRSGVGDSWETEPGTINQVDVQAVFRYRSLRGAR